MHYGPVPRGMLVDHRDRNPFNNKLSNLRLATTGQNNSNSRLRYNVSGLKGVTWEKREKRSGRWVAQIVTGRKRILIGRFRDKYDAARAYDAAAERFHGEFAATNAALGLLETDREKNMKTEYTPGTDATDTE